MTGKRDYTHIVSGDAGIRNAAEVASGLREALEGHEAISVDTRTLTAADVTTVQTLIAARVSATAKGKTLTLAAPLGESLRAVLADAGLLSPDQTHRDFWPLSPDQP